MPMSEMIKTKDLSYSYADTIQPNALVLKDINLTVPNGQFLAVLGRNGSGKSTFAKHCNAICVPTGGSVYVAGLDTKNPDNLIPIRTQASMVFQNPDNQIVSTIVEEDVAFALENLGIPSPQIRQRVDNALKTVGMYEYRMHAPHLLSGGQKQRIAIAGALALMPRCIIFDEPTAMLDPQGRAEVMEVIRHLNEDFHITIVLITHHMEEAVQAQRIVVLDHGSVALDGTPSEIFSRPIELTKLGLAPPQTVALIQAVNDAAGVMIPTDALTVDECADRLASFLLEGGMRA